MFLDVFPGMVFLFETTLTYEGLSLPTILVPCYSQSFSSEGLTGNSSPWEYWLSSL